MSIRDADPPRPVIFGCADTRLSPAEARFFAEVKPLGFILFGRNCADPGQMRALTGALREAVGRADAPILIDQEGGRVQRLGPPHWRSAPPAAAFGALYQRDPEKGLAAARLNAELLARDLAALGIDVDCAPVLDVPAEGAHDIIGDRAFGRDPNAVATLGGATIAGLLAGGVLPVIKHIPGHGRARVDSHVTLPTIDASAKSLEAIDLVPFRALNDAPWAMTAHVVYTAYDAERPATISPTVIGEVIRGQIGFSGFLVSDDINMQALSGSAAKRAAAAVAAGCDAVLHCSGALDEMRAVAAVLAPMAEGSLMRLAAGQARRREPAPVDPAASARLEQFLQAARG